MIVFCCLRIMHVGYVYLLDSKHVAVLHLRPRPPNLPPWRFLSSGDPAGGGCGGGGGGGAEEPVGKLGVLLQSGRFQASLTLAKALICSHKTLFPSPFHLYQALSLSFPSPIPSAASLLVAACAHLKLPDDGLHLVFEGPMFAT